MRFSRKSATAFFAGLSIAIAGLLYVRQRTAACWVCERPFHVGVTAKIKTGLFWRKTCCLRCALNYGDAHPGKVHAFRVTDYATGRWLKAEDAIYVVGSDVEPCHRMGAERAEPGVEAAPKWDRCVPSAIAFQEKAAAEQFARDHGGALASWPVLRGRG